MIKEPASAGYYSVENCRTKHKYRDFLRLFTCGLYSCQSPKEQLLYEHDQFDSDNELLREQLHYAWDTSGLWPAAILQPDENKLRLEWAARDGPKEDGPALVPYLKASTRQKWATTLEKRPAQAAWTELDLRKSRQLAALSVDTTMHAVYTPIFDNAPSIEIALALGWDAVATELARAHLLGPLTNRHHPDSGRTADRMPELRSPRLWGLLCDGWLRRELGVTVSQTTRFVDESLAWLHERLENGPARPYREHTTEHLCHLLNDAYIKADHPDADPQTSIGWLYERGEEIAATYLNEPATEDEILELESRAKQENYPEGLPEDYKSFLRVTNGVCHPRWDSVTIFSPTRKVRSSTEVSVVELLHRNTLSGHSRFLIDRPISQREYLTLGHDRNHGSFYVIDQATTRTAVALFKKIYDAASRDDRRRFERAATDVYGSMEQLMTLEYFMVRHEFDVFSATSGTYAGFRHLLETAVMHINEQLEATSELIHMDREDDSLETENSLGTDDSLGADDSLEPDDDP
nr:hypothetical protein CFP56_70235 [Quercus suber]